MCWLTLVLLHFILPQHTLTVELTLWSEKKLCLQPNLTSWVEQAQSAAFLVTEAHSKWSKSCKSVASFFVLLGIKPHSLLTTIYGISDIFAVFLIFLSWLPVCGGAAGASVGRGWGCCVPDTAGSSQFQTVPAALHGPSAKMVAPVGKHMQETAKSPMSVWGKKCETQPCECQGQKGSRGRGSSRCWSRDCLESCETGRRGAGIACSLWRAGWSRYPRCSLWWTPHWILLEGDVVCGELTLEQYYPETL